MVAMRNRAVILFIVSMVFLAGGCSPKHSEPPDALPISLGNNGKLASMRIRRMAEPMVAVVVYNKEDSFRHEAVQYLEIGKLPISVRNQFSAYEGLGIGETMVYLSLFERREDPEKAGNLLLKFEVLYQQEVLDVPLVSWNQEDDLDLIGRDNWLVKLSRKIMVEE